MARAATQNEVNETQAAQARSSMNVWGILGIVVVLAFLAAIVAGAFVWRSTEVAAAEAAAQAETSTVARSALVTFDTFVVNLADPVGDRYLKATLRAVSTDPTLPITLTRNQVLRTRVRDRVITVLTGKTFAEVHDPVGKETLRRQLAHEINSVLGTNAIQEILFIEFVVQ
jgi:flagellar FliL protein